MTKQSILEIQSRIGTYPEPSIHKPHDIMRSWVVRDADDKLGWWIVDAGGSGHWITLREAKDYQMLLYKNEERIPAVIRNLTRLVVEYQDKNWRVMEFNPDAGFLLSRGFGDVIWLKADDYFIKTKTKKLLQ